MLDALHLRGTPSRWHVAVAIGGTALILLTFARPSLIADTRTIVIFPALVLMALIISHYRQAILAAATLIFFWSGTPLWGNTAMQVARWWILSIAALVGAVIWLSGKIPLRFSALHFFAAFVALAAFASGFQSVNPLMTLLKATSLAMLFSFGAVGARLCFQNAGRLSRLLSTGAEGLVWVTIISYALFSFALWDNSNSLGVITGIICWPILLWRWLTLSSGWPRTRIFVLMAICAALLLMSHARASMLSAGTASIVLLFSTRRYKLLLLGAAMLAAIGALFFAFPNSCRQILNTVVFKSRAEATTVNLLESRRRTWDQSLETFAQHPLFGIGFGISEESVNWCGDYSSLGQVRERGDSYLGALEELGVVGILPVALLLAALLLQIFKVVTQIRRCGLVSAPVLPIAALLFAALCHAFFEDWLFAPGYYLTFIFWSLALSLPDISMEPAFLVRPIQWRQVSNLDASTQRA